MPVNPYDQIETSYQMQPLQPVQVSSNPYDQIESSTQQPQSSQNPYDQIESTPRQISIEKNAIMQPVQVQTEQPPENNDSGWLPALGTAAAALGALALTKGRSMNEAAPVLEKTFQKIIPEGYNSIKTGITRYVDEHPIRFNIPSLKNGTIDYKKLGETIRYEHQGDLNANHLRGVHLGIEVSKLPEAQDQGLYLRRDVLHSNTPEVGLAKLQRLVQLKPELKQAAGYAINPTKEMQQHEASINQYFHETGQAGNQYGYLSHLKDNESYSNRIYGKPPEKLQKTEVYRNGLPKSTYHGKERVFNDIVDAIEYGMNPATYKQSDLITVHAGEHSKVLANNKIFQALEQHGLGMKAPEGRISAGYAKIGNGNFVVRQELAPHIKAITESKTVDFGIIKKINAVLKANLLGGSDAGFHFLNTSKNFFSAGMSIKDFFQYGLDKEIRLAYARSGGILKTTDLSKEVLHELQSDTNPLIKLVTFIPNNPVSQWLNKKLFEEYIPAAQTALWAKNMVKWGIKHPGATPEEIKIAARSFADHANNMGGFSNLTAKGMTQNQQEIGQQLVLALQWNAAKVNHLMQLAESTPGGHEARLTLARGLAGSLMFGNLLNIIFTGHSMDKNPKGQHFSVQWGKDSRVYTPVLSPPYEDALKLYEKAKEKGLIGGVTNFVTGKGSPVYGMGKSLADIAQNTDYFGRHITQPLIDTPPEKNYKQLKYFVEQNNYLPIGLVQNTEKLIKKGDTNPVDYLIASLGIGIVGKTQEEQNKQERIQKIIELKEKRKLKRSKYRG